MLFLTIPPHEFYNEKENLFINTKEQGIALEHSLLSLSKWESKWCKPFLGDTLKTYEESIDYIRCMTITPNVDPLVYRILTKENIEEINKYISAPMTATWFREEHVPPRREVITSELIYYWMISFGIPFECQKWHLNRLLTLIKVCNAKNAPPKKMSKRDVMAHNRALNMARRAASGSRG